LGTDIKAMLADEKRKEKNAILIIEDDVKFASLLEEKFSNMGFDTEVINQLSLLELSLTKQIWTHCILDLNLNHQSGLTAIKKILNASKGCKIVILTAYASVQTSIEAIKLGAVYLLSKPSRMQEILNAFQHSIEDKEIKIWHKKGISELTEEMIQISLNDHDFNISKTADFLGIHRRTLQRKLKKMKLNPNDTF